MLKMKNVIGICGSASRNSANLSILKWIAKSAISDFSLEIIDDLTKFPHFSTELTVNNVPQSIVDFRKKIENADGIINLHTRICF